MLVLPLNIPVMVFIRPAPPFFLGELGDDPASLPDPASNLSKESLILSFGAGAVIGFDSVCAFEATSLRLGVLLGVETLEGVTWAFAALL